MKALLLKARDLALKYLTWGWPLLLADVLLETQGGRPAGAWRSFLNHAAFLWILCAPAAPLSLLLDRPRRERAMARLFGVREADERERSVTGEAARSTLLLGLSLEILLMAMSLINFRLAWNPAAPKGERGSLSIGMGFSTSRHLDPFGAPFKRSPTLDPGDAGPGAREADIAGGFLLAPSTFPVLALLILIQLAAFRAIAMRRYEGTEA